MPACVMRPFVALAALMCAAVPGHAAKGSNDVSLAPKIHEGLCFDVQGGAPRAGAAVQLWQCAGTPGQRWQLASGAVRVFDNMCLEVTDGIDRDGTGLQVADCGASNPNQRFARVGDQLRWVGHDRCVDVARGRRKNGTRLGIWTCSKNNDNQRFVVQPQLASENEAGRDDAVEEVADFVADDLAAEVTADYPTDVAEDVAQDVAGSATNVDALDDVAVWESGDEASVAPAATTDDAAAEPAGDAFASDVRGDAPFDADAVAADATLGNEAADADAAPLVPDAVAVPVAPVVPVVAPPAQASTPAATKPRGTAAKVRPASGGEGRASAKKLQSAGTFLGVRHISLASFLNKHPVLKPLRQDLIDAAKSVQPSLPPVLLAAIAMEESSGNPDVAGGLMQLTSTTVWAEYGHGDVNDARDSLFAAASYLSELLRQENDDLSAALRAYNGDANGNYVGEITTWLNGGSPYGEGT